MDSEDPGPHAVDSAVVNASGTSDAGIADIVMQRYGWTIHDILALRKGGKGRKSQLDWIAEGINEMRNRDSKNSKSSRSNGLQKTFNTPDAKWASELKRKYAKVN